MNRGSQHKPWVEVQKIYSPVDLYQSDSLLTQNFESNLHVHRCWKCLVNRQTDRQTDTQRHTVRITQSIVVTIKGETIKEVIFSQA